MEIFIKIPYQKSETNGNMITIAMSDMKQGIRFMIKDKPEVIKALKEMLDDKTLRRS